MNMEFSYNDIKKEFNSKQKFENGCGVVIDLNEIENSNEGIFKIKLIPNITFPGILAKEKVVEVGFYKGNNIVYDINILEHIYEYISIGENILKNVDVTKNITVLLNLYTQALTFGIYNIGTGIKKYYNYYIKFPLTYFF